MLKWSLFLNSWHQKLNGKWEIIGICKDPSPCMWHHNIMLIAINYDSLCTNCQFLKTGLADTNKNYFFMFSVEVILISEFRNSEIRITSTFMFSAALPGFHFEKLLMYSMKTRQNKTRITVLTKWSFVNRRITLL